MHARKERVDRAVADFVRVLVARTEALLGEDLLALSLVGSLSTGDAHPATSDIDVLVLVDQAPDGARRDGLADEVVALGLECPWAGVSMSSPRLTPCGPRPIRCGTHSTSTPVPAVTPT
ncbi:MAG: nucleotidyltransferase domain-containing protein [Egibacteraceae bacterium]